MQNLKFSKYGILLLHIASQSFIAQGRSTKRPQLSDDYLPLLLTPFIEAGKISEAQQLSYVETDVIPPSHSGFLTVDKRKGNHLFFWYFPSETNSKAQLLIWLAGGPGASSMNSIIDQNGPVEIQVDKQTGRQYLHRRNVTMVGQFSMLYIDQPVGTGYSYSDTNSFAETQEEYTQDLFNFIHQFYNLFPEHYKHPLYIGGNSYAGKYVPAIAFKIHHNILNNNSTLPLEGIYIGNPYFDPDSMNVASYELPFVLGAISHEEFKESQEYEKLISTIDKSLRDVIFPHELTSLLNDTKYILRKERVYLRDRLHPYKFIKAESKTPSFVDVFMNYRGMRKLLHVGNVQSFQRLNSQVYRRLRRDIMRSVKYELGVLMDNYKVLVYGGNLDVRVSVSMIERALLSTPWSKQGEYNSSKRLVWRRRMSPEDSLSVTAFYTKVGDFCRVIVHNAGHSVPTDQPEFSLMMMQDFVNHGCIDNTLSPGQSPYIRG